MVSNKLTSALAWFLISILIVVLLGLLAIDDRSLWIDEFGTWIAAQKTDLRSWFDAFLHIKDSDGQLFFYHLYIFYWTKYFGDSEIALRASNLPWIFLASLAIAMAPLGCRLRIIWLAFFFIHSFVWYYANEARPYIASLAGGAFLTTAFIEAAKSARDPSANFTKAMLLYFCGSALLAGIHVLGFLWVFSVGVSMLVLARDRLPSLLPKTAGQIAIVLACCLVMGVSLVVALHSFGEGTRAATNGFSIGGLAYGFIEVLGVAGLGPNRNELRDGLTSSLLLRSAPMLIAAVLAGGAVLCAVLRFDRRTLALAVFAALAPVVALCVLGELLTMRIVGRHFAALVVPVTFSYAVIIGHWLKNGGRYLVLVAGLVILLVWSSVSMRLSANHMKEDYRTASQIAVQQLKDNSVVWWAADWRGALYYGVTEPGGKRPRHATQHNDTPGAAPKSLIFFPSEKLQANEQIQPPDTVVLSRADTYDKGGLIHRYIDQHGYKLTRELDGFMIYSR